MIERIASGIPGLDEVIEEGFPFPSVVLILGEPGTGKTTFGMQSLFYGARSGETNIYMTGVAEPVFMIKKFMSKFDFYDEELVKEGKVQFWDLGSSIQTMGPKKALSTIADVVRQTKATRITIDPLPLSHLFASAFDYRKYLYEFLTALRNLNVFTLIIGEKTPESIADVEAYMVDGLIFLELKTLDNPLVYKNLMRVRKLRGTNHTKDVLSMELSLEGISVFRME